MQKDTTTINCPKCAAEINVNEALYHQLEDQIKKDYERKSVKKERDIQSKLDELDAAKKKFSEDKKKQYELIEKQVQTGIKLEKTKLEKKIRQQVDEEKSEEVASLMNSLQQKSTQLKELNKTKALVSQLQLEKDELKEKIEAEALEEFNKRLAAEKVKIKSTENEKSKTEVQKRDKLIEDLTKRLEDAQLKLEQGSNKLAGEVKEIELREFLKCAHPIDEIKDVASGVTGADVVHVVRNNLGQPSGSILYERKHTQSFVNDWISKIKEDGRRVNADICVIVTRTMPKGNNQTHLRDGVWVCKADDVLIITTLLRDGLIKQYSAFASQQDKGSKMEMLYDYLRSTDFQNHILGLLDAFNKMDRSLNKEKIDAWKRFAEREAHLEQAKKGIINFWGRVDGIAQDGLNDQMKKLDNNEQQQLPGEE